MTFVPKARLELELTAPCFLEICEALNVTVSPGPRIQHLIGDNVTLFCHVSQKRRRENLLAVRWVFALPSAQEYLMIKMTKFGVVQYYGNYTSRFYKRRLHLLEEKHRTMYTFLILNIQQAEQGHYICKVQEISKQRNKWTSWSNGSASTEVQVFPSRFLDEEKHNAWAFFEDLSVYAVLMSSAGILSILLFALVILCQILSNKKRSHVKHTLVKSPQKSLQDTGSPSKAAGSPGLPIQRKGAKATEAPPAVPAKAPISHAFSKPKLLKPQRKVTLRSLLPKQISQSPPDPLGYQSADPKAAVKMEGPGFFFSALAPNVCPCFEKTAQKRDLGKLHKKEERFGQSEIQWRKNAPVLDELFFPVLQN
ncbi:V-set and transmembrane domain-containing protein 4-like isoform X3 [Pantherophis guttatus]|uniref:V-set and transmembrane domain-containing protein 4-like isoform X3 n=1 Tax=Pantherophis guttatus TaxID=94885 RepID=A0ABM3YQQ5_PANGU|nr:V-set and transmembrane domain-containing protein 4-like isoform X3 [Pantherophis guttatus]